MPSVKGESGRAHIPGEEGIWLFIFGDMLFFALFFITFTYYRAHDPSGYDQSQLLLSRSFGLANTLLLLTSSWLVATALRAFRQERYAVSGHLLTAGALLGIGFIVSKVLEWSEKLRHGITLQTNEFFMFYFMFTGIHLIHVVIGVGVLGFLVRQVRHAPAGPKMPGLLEGGAAFWHLVDMLWVVLFALLYLMH